MVKTTVASKPFDSAEYLDTPEAIVAYLEEIFEGSNPALIAHGIGVVARAKGMSELAEKAGLSRESLYRTLSAEGNPELSTLLKVLGSLGVKLSVEPGTSSGEVRKVRKHPIGKCTTVAHKKKSKKRRPRKNALEARSTRRAGSSGS